MKTIQVQLFRFSELSDEAKRHALNERRESEQHHCLDHVYQDINSSLKAITDALGTRLKEAYYGPSERDYGITVDTDNTPRQDLSKFARVLIQHGYERKPKLAEWEFPGVCGFTGVWSDETIVEHLWGGLRVGDGFTEAFQSLAEHLCQVLEKEYDYLTSDEYLLEGMSEEEIYLESGETH